jgi:hypothetical protein
MAVAGAATCLVGTTLFATLTLVDIPSAMTQQPVVSKTFRGFYGVQVIFYVVGVLLLLLGILSVVPPPHLPTP